MAVKSGLNKQQKHLAVLIDADNASAAIVEGLFEEIAKYGVASVKRIYGDWTGPQLGSWKKVLLEHSIQPIQQFAYTTGKNATDSSMIIDAMDLLYTHRFEGFCLVSSDSDFTRLAARIREEGLEVIGVGEQKTPKPFISACDTFIYSELLRKEQISEEPEVTSVPASEAPATETAAAKPPKAPTALIAKVIDDISDEDGWTTLSALGVNIRKLKPDFDARLYGYAKLSELIKARNGQFEMQQQGVTATGGRVLAVRNRKNGGFTTTIKTVSTY
ncbi:NYN domain-containing protein [Pseudomonas sp. TTU2014-080ASC]|uniref:NYN domain-containing protein n=1 Tax=Pseudomonas sp. TTU2014-080ASC TaxID=1729724 RepID=UPI0007187BF9|nr:NYN domain-containing protein [Pseudomonas sp. TTU2014-080ASC]KRW58509.1 hypothetical protein AO726_16845 [Pseudomonas sp. TTU2014-080ASC]